MSDDVHIVHPYFTISYHEIDSISITFYGQDEKSGWWHGNVSSSALLEWHIEEFEEFMEFAQESLRQRQRDRRQLQRKSR